ncbi:Multidrug efflux pump subunit AcrB [Desulfocicer vacuolatum DSM 3385]|uniref:Multidrug efflux pump subunit AcrB n=1 Tax=Desulfocicer vacuolatum DSM 3385 TaxID=1121400 RepID=A0A1W2DSA5_9BACT|nr:efflux RND transporter permease subunit [Desulfocicer vacuolatum]SMD00273.1 Multidrug efflux pump subunit AcrB [Desulfocicer vacuolatum DSM 3385]
MNSIKKGIAFLCKHPTASNLMMLLFIILGFMTVKDLRRETFPDFSVDAVQISAIYPGATAEDVESAVCRRIEDAIEEVNHIDRIESTARENRATVVVEMMEGKDVMEFFNDIKTDVEAISDFPGEVEDLIIKRINRTDQVISVAVTGPMSDLHLKLYCESLKDRLKQLDLVSQVELLGFSDHEFLIEIPTYQMMRLGLSISDIQAVITSQSIDMPSGSLETKDKDILIRFAEERRSIGELSNLVIISNPDGAEIRLGEIARISDSYIDEENKIFFNGKRAGMLQINKTKAEDALRILDAVNAFLDKERLQAPPNVSFTTTQNRSKVVRDRLDMLTINGLQGLFLVFLAMICFFPFKFSFWVTMGLPVSFLLTFFFMKQIDFSLNMLSMVGLLIGLGLLMDDAIVIAENIAAHLEKGKKAFDAVVDGISEVAAGVFSSFLTTLFIFGALALSMSGNIGKVLYAIPVVLILTLSVSLVEAFCILPNHLFHSLSHEEIKRDGHTPTSTMEKSSSGMPKNRFSQIMDGLIDWLRDKLLGKIVDIVVNWRYLFAGIVVFVFILSIAMIAGGHLKIKAFPEIDGDVLQARVLLPQGTPLVRTEQVVNQLVTAAKQINETLKSAQPGNADLIENISAIFNTNADAGETGPHVATVSLDLLSAEERSTALDDITARWRTLVGEVPDCINIAYKEPSFGPGGLAIEILLQGENFDELKLASTTLINWLYTYKGVMDLDDNLRPGKPEIKVRLKPGARARGFNARNIATQLRAAFYGNTAGEILVGEESYEVNVRIANEDRAVISALERFYLMGPNKEKVPLSSVATLEETRGYAGINRINSMRTVTITADVDSRVANAAQIIADTRKNFLPRLHQQFPGVKVVAEGEEKETKESMGGMIKALLIGIFGVFCILSFQFKSYIEPMVVMITIPFAFIGVVWGHIFMGLDLSMPSIMGFVSLSGIVVNDSILLVSFIKIHMKQGQNVTTAATLASRERFRAVMLTSLTTIVGLLPLLSERSMQAQILIPLAASIVFGLLASTVLVLLVVPSLYAILGDFIHLGQHLDPAKDQEISALTEPWSGYRIIR